MAIFGATVAKKARVFQSGSAKATIGASPAILLGVQIQIQRQMSPVPTLTDGVVWAAQPVSGSLTANSILVASESMGLIKSLTEQNVCTPMACSVTLDNSCDAKGVQLMINDGYCSAISFSANGNQGYVGNDFTIQFTSCDVVG